MISRSFVSAGGFTTHSTTTPTSDFLRNGTSTRQPICTEARIPSGIAYVNVVRSRTGSATLQNGADIALVVYQQSRNSSADEKNAKKDCYDAKPLQRSNAFA